MAAVTIRKLPEDVHAVLKRRANEKGRSTEAEIRETLISATKSSTQQLGFGTELHEFWKKAGSPELVITMIFDTNVVSEPLRAKPNEKVMGWLDKTDVSRCFITAITVAELLSGVERLLPGKKRENLNSTVSQIADKHFAGRILSFDIVAAKHFAIAIEKLRRLGLNGMNIDVMIAAIALAHDLPVATRDERPYISAGVRVINPWADE
jgi:toxin FitB